MEGYDGGGVRCADSARAAASRELMGFDLFLNNARGAFLYPSCTIRVHISLNPHLVDSDTDLFANSDTATLAPWHW